MSSGKTFHCSGCEETLSVIHFSKNQLRKRHHAKCKQCVADSCTDKGLFISKYSIDETLHLIINHMFYGSLEKYYQKLAKMNSKKSIEHGGQEILYDFGLPKEIQGLILNYSLFCKFNYLTLQYDFYFNKNSLPKTISKLTTLSSSTMIHIDKLQFVMLSPQNKSKQKIYELSCTYCYL